MHIVELKAENFKRLKAVEIIPDPKKNLVIISGKNDAGKTSVLDVIWAVLGGKKALKDTPQPIREGEKEARGFLDLGEFKVTRHWTSNKVSYLKVENSKGFQAKSPQQLVDSFIGKLTFDPLEFIRLEGPEQREILLDLVGLKDKFQEFELERDKIYDSRTEAGRELKTLKAQIPGGKFPDDLPEREISVLELTDKLEKIREKNRKLEENIDEFHYLEAEIKDNKVEIKKLQEKNSLLEIKLSILRKEIEVQPKLLDPEEIKTQISRAEATNRQIREYNRTEELKSKARDLEDIVTNLTGKLQRFEDWKKERLSEAKMPVPGLSIEAEGVTFRGIPLSQQGSATQLKVSMAMAMALNPELRVIRITDGSLLDEENMKIIEEMAKDYQIWIERVDESGKIGFVIEEGEVKNA